MRRFPTPVPPGTGDTVHGNGTVPAPFPLSPKVRRLRWQHHKVEALPHRYKTRWNLPVLKGRWLQKGKWLLQTRHLNLFGAVRGHKQCIHEIPLEHLQPVPAFLRSAREGAMYESSVPENDTVPLHRIEYKHTFS